MAKELLKEAIADAKAVREVALENAKSALEEAFTPKIKSMLSAKITEDLEDTQEGMEYESTENDVYSEGDEEDDNLEELFDLEEEDLNITDDSEGDVGATEESNSMEEEIDLEEILNELEALEEEGSKEEEEETIDEEIDVNALLEELNLDEEIDLTEFDMEETENDNLNEDFGITAAAGIIAAALATMAGGAAGVEKLKEKNPKLKKALDAVGGAAGSASGSTGTKQESVSEVEDEEEMKEMKQELREAHRANRYLKSQISEINLLNSKLLYTNKIFKAFSLNDSQKLRVVEALDNAGNVKEAKLVFNTLKESFIVSKPKISIREGLGMASKAAGKSTARKEIITESSQMIDRFQKLANIN
jgi:hypothetical protein